MTSQSLNHIQTILTQIQIYSLGANTHIDQELAAYDTGFTLLEKELRNFELDTFVPTASPEALVQHEEAGGLFSEPQLDLSLRRNMLSARYQIAPTAFRYGDIQQLLASCGIQGRVAELRESISIAVDRVLHNALSLEQIHTYLEQLLPAQLEWSLIYGLLTFQEFDGKDITWTRWGEEDFTWSTFDQKGEALFT